MLLTCTNLRYFRLGYRCRYLFDSTIIIPTFNFIQFINCAHLFTAYTHLLGAFLQPFRHTHILDPIEHALALQFTFCEYLTHVLITHTHILDYPFECLVILTAISAPLQKLLMHAPAIEFVFIVDATVFVETGDHLLRLP